MKWLLLDLNSFFASCEQQENPSLRGKPVAVVPMLTNSTSVIAASYEAKKFGIKTNTKVSDAKKMCPELILKTGNHRLYTEYHHKIKKACEEVLPVKKTLSIDEFSFELLGKEQLVANALNIAQKMKDHVQKVVGSEIKSSIGIGPNILLAKIASDMQKPNGLVHIEKDKILERIGHLPIDAVPGIGRKMKHRLNAYSYQSIADLINAPEQMLRKHWGSIWGLRVSRELKGEDLMLKKSNLTKSFSHQHVLPPKFRNNSAAFQILLKLLLKAATRLRADKYKCHRLSVYIKLQDHTRFENSVGFSQTDDFLFLSQELKKLYPSVFKASPIKVCVVLSDFTDHSEQLSFFDNPLRRNINFALDEINQKYGHNTLFLASTLPILSSAKTRIAFNHIPNKSDEFEEIDS